MVKKQKYSDEFKREAVRLMENRGGRSVDQVADDVGVSTSQLYAWRNKYGSGNVTRGSAEAPSDELKTEILRLKRELERVTKERELLKKSMADSGGRCNRLMLYCFMRGTASGNNETWFEYRTEG